ncbi:hypothetical protein R1flu_013599 [Riccia fluitans]|uniref:Reverse transcriptase zinc-binding domain-containing protein n=1 Tax=Riccia fluitans TaxID=41844 RepID=A0ABD1YE11_9MARC
MPSIPLGTNAEGKAKTSLVSWESVTKTKNNGGLNIRPFQRVSMVLKMRYAGRLMNGDDSDWAQLICRFTRQRMHCRSGSKELKHWAAEEGLLLLPSISTPQSETANNIIKSWLYFRKYLILDMQALELPGNLTLRQLKMLTDRYCHRRPFTNRVTYPLLKKIGVTVLANLTSSSGAWISMTAALRARGIQLSQTQLEAIQVLQDWLASVKIGPQKLQCSPSWRWKRTDVEWKGWNRPSNFWHRLAEADELPDDMTGKWPEYTLALTWKARWRKLWETGGSPRVKIWIWRILRRGFFTGERAERMRVAFDPCSRCKTASESVSHLFYDCKYPRDHWRQLQELATKTNISFQVPDSLLAIIDEALRTKKKGCPLVYILYSITRTLWTDRNLALFQRKHQNTPLRVSLEHARVEVEGSFNDKCSAERWQRGLQALKEMNMLILEAGAPSPHPANTQAELESEQLLLRMQRLNIQVTIS